MLYAFGDYTLDAVHYELRRAEGLVPVAPRAFDLLAYLVQHAGQTVSKEELFAQLWAAQFVTDSALTYCVTEARKAMGDSGRGQRYIRTVYGRGYRFIVPVAVHQETAAEAPPPAWLACGGSRASGPQPMHSWPRYTAASPRALTPPTCKRPGRCWSSCKGR
jgi:DNA-binding winged helix-turn-helix (wHTH) protein